jgi:hypothetical protein
VRVITHRAYLLQIEKAQARADVLVKLMEATGKCQQLRTGEWVWTGTQSELMAVMQHVDSLQECSGCGQPATLDDAGYCGHCAGG